MPELVLKLKGREVRRVALAKPEMTIGRDPGCDLLVDNPAISRVHVVIRRVGEQFTAVDQGSANGTWVRGGRIQTHGLADGDELQLGKHTVVFTMRAEDRQNGTGVPRMTLQGIGTDVAPGRSKNPMGTMRMSPEQVQRAISAGQLPASAAAAIPEQPASEPPPPAAAERGSVSMGCIAAIVLVVGLVGLAAAGAVAAWYFGLIG